MERQGFRLVGLAFSEYTILKMNRDHGIALTLSERLSDPTRRTYLLVIFSE